MTRNLPKASPLFLALLVPLTGCASGPSASVKPAYFALCPLDSHTEAYPNNPNPKRAYGCVSNTHGFLRYPGDERERMTPEFSVAPR
jgi:hypothetical protein